MKKIVIIFSVSLTLLVLLLIWIISDNKNDTLSRFEDHLRDDNFSFETYELNEDNLFNLELVGKKPVHFRISEEDSLHVYSYPFNIQAPIAKGSFRAKTETYDMVSYNLYTINNLFIIYEYNSEIDNVNEELDNSIKRFN
ncbi:hypothetical protein GH741_00275 [Aquibacillus halophilus]|uniref:Uncharacterized protein n=1 Tax=Aquibacillus halophilus TaxID=930132 RepID=A0A6A8DDW8_9BACI|nr:hypothetical protein [Aquibacillus halophilus]MRH41107.1 hypothetical protein [Aquibacillus halophilus]